jgi:hypothetical protein
MPEISQDDDHGQKDRKTNGYPSNGSILHTHPIEQIFPVRLEL